MKNRIILVIYIVQIATAIFSQAHLLKNINEEGEVPNFNYIHSLKKAGDHIFFSGEQCAESPKVYAIDLMNDSIFMPKNTWAAEHYWWCQWKPFWSGFKAKNLTPFNNELYYIAYNDHYGIELWKTDGTFDGTGLVKDIRNGSKSSNPNHLFVFKNKIWFTAFDETHGNELWTSDGTAANTQFFFDIIPGEDYADFDHFMELNGYLYFTVENEGILDLWRTDGTAAGTQYFKTLVYDNGSNWNFNYIGVFLNKIIYGYKNYSVDIYYLGMIDPINQNLETIHGFREQDGFPGPPDHFFEYNGQLYFTIYQDTLGEELWRTDGSSDGTQLAMDFNPGSAGSDMEQFTLYNGHIYFVAKKDDVHVLCGSNGLLNGTEIMDTIDATNASYLKPYIFKNNDRLFYFKNNFKELMSTDGTTKKLHFSWTGLSHLNELIIDDNAIYFLEKNNAEVFKIYKWTDQMIGPVPVKGFVAGDGSSGFRPNFEINDKIYGFHWGTNGYELWETDGTTENTLSIGNYSPTPTLLKDSLLLYVEFENDSLLIWSSNGLFGAKELVNIFDFTPLGIASYFSTIKNGYAYVIIGNDDGGTYGLIVTDGTAAGTKVLDENVIMIRDWTKYNGNYFTNAYYPDGSYLLKTDNTHEGTQIITQLDTLHYPIYAFQPTVYNNLLFYFKMNDDKSWGLWRSDGTAINETMVAQLNPPNEGYPRNLYVVNEKLIFWANDGMNGNEPWVSDGTTSGTKMLKDINPEPMGGFGTSRPFVFNDKLYFSLNHPLYGYELWVSDATENGTHLLKDIIPGVVGSSPNLYEAIVVDSFVYFPASSERYGNEIWRTDGSTEGTLLLQDLCKGPCSSFPVKLYSFGEDQFLFRAYTSEYGHEPWVYFPSEETPKEDTIDIQFNDFLLYPNPSNGSGVNILLKKENNISQLQFINLNGQLIQRYKIQPGTELIHLNLKKQLPAGIYFIQFFNNEGILKGVEKLVIGR